MDAAWAQIDMAWNRLRDVHLRDLCADKDRFDQFSRSLDDLTLDASRERLDRPALDALIGLARAAGVEEQRDAMISGAPINSTENRAALHMALRAAPEDGLPHTQMVAEERARMLDFAEEVRASNYRDVVNIGIGGSDLGPAMAVQALDGDGPRVHFVSNVDGADLVRVLDGLDPAHTLFIIASKTFTTIETMTNAQSARDWLIAAGCAPEQHLAALSTNLDATSAFGVPQARVFGFWDWVGGRYSVWSAIGLALAIHIGARGFTAFLQGARAMDRHFCTAPLEDNLPVWMALIGIWRRNAMGCGAVAVLPYDQRLARLPAYLQQLVMESNGKRVGRDGHAVRATSPVIWGEPGTNAQHSFMQMLHQGTDIIPVDFILAAEAGSRLEAHHDLLIANCLAQAEALAFGRTVQDLEAEGTAPDLIPHRSFPGNRPSTILLHQRLDAFSLGRLIALYEHKVFVEGVIWGINSFDQWGVELGKKLAIDLLPQVTGVQTGTGLITRIRALRYSGH